MNKSLQKIILASLLSCCSNLVSAHEGHDHEEVADPKESLVGVWTVTETTNSQVIRGMKFHAGHSHGTITTLLKMSFCMDESDNFYGLVTNNDFIEDAPIALQVSSIENGDTEGSYTIHLSSTEDESVDEHLHLTLNNASKKPKKRNLTVKAHGGTEFTAKPKLPLKATKACLGLIPQE